MSLRRSDLKPWVLDALQASGGSATVTEIAKHIWNNHQHELHNSGDFFYTWQYGMRWAGKSLSDEGMIIKDKAARLWRLI